MDAFGFRCIVFFGEAFFAGIFCEGPHSYLPKLHYSLRWPQPPNPYPAMSLTRRKFIKKSALVTAASLAAPRFFSRAGAADAPVVPPSSNLPIAPGPFQPTWESLSNFQTPDWFRDAKFGIWAHWGPQCQPEQGDWYARKMYIPGDSSHDYEYHVKTYGHPSKFGFKDVINTWKAERWDPEHLIGLYKRAGAKYFCALANHHDNLDLWDSKLSAVEFRRGRTEERPRRRLGQGHARGRPALRRQLARLACVDVV